MKKSKYNWQKLKFDFFQSDSREVKGFFEEQYGTYNGRIRVKTTGWTKEKEQWQKEIAEAALLKLKNNRTEELAHCLDLLLFVIGKKVNSYLSAQKVDSRDIKILWEILRSENNLPIRVIKATPSDNNGFNFENARKEFDKEIAESNQ